MAAEQPAAEQPAAALPIPPKGELAPNMAAWVRPYTPGPLSEAQVTQFFTEGFTVSRGLLSRAELDPARAAVGGLVDAAARRLHAAGKISDLAEGEPFEKRLIAIERQSPNASVLLHKQGVLPPGIAGLWAGPTLLACARQLVGGDIAGHPVWNLRCKTPNEGQATVPWHQDTSYLDPVALGTLQATAWVPLVDATRENGCMEVIRYGHRAGREVAHECCVGGTWYVSIKEGALAGIGADDPADVVLCDVAAGDVLWLNNVVPHRSLNNASDHVRWSLDLRYQRPDEPAGFYDIKAPIRLAKADDPAFAPDWAEWAGVERTAKQMAALADAAPGIMPELAAAAAAEAVPGADDPFDTVIAGPWMKRWPRSHHNRHTERHDALEKVSAGGKVAGWHAVGTAFG